MPDLSMEYADLIAQAVLDKFEDLPQKYKPRARNAQKQEWVTLSGIVLEDISNSFTCVSLGTGMKCLPKDKVMLSNGVTLHDCHAEVLALRAFNSFLLHECQSVADGSESSWIQQIDGTPRPFKVRDHLKIYMYCSEAPCGDASMELVMAEQEDPTPWVPPEADQTSPDGGLLHGRGYFSQLGIVRTKPSRPDAPPTLSKSCTDKLALKQCTSMLNSITATLIQNDNTYIHALVLPEKQCVTTAYERAFGPTGRFAQLPSDLSDAWGVGYNYRPFHVIATSREFRYSKRSKLPAHELIASNVCAVWTPHFQEALINGSLQGRKQFDPRGASALSRKAMWKGAVELVDTHSLSTQFAGSLRCSSYDGLKDYILLQERARVKEDVRRLVLRPWARNIGDEGFSLED